MYNQDRSSEVKGLAAQLLNIWNYSHRKVSVSTHENEDESQSKNPKTKDRLDRQLAAVNCKNHLQVQSFIQNSLIFSSN